MNLRELRQQLRARRRAISDAERPGFDQSIRASLRRLGVWRRGARVAAFLGMPGEVDLRPCFAAAWQRGVQVYVPYILSMRNCAMAFVPLRPGTPLHGNRFGRTTIHRFCGRQGRYPVPFPVWVPYFEQRYRD